jgi:hypothetical protein
MGKGKGSNRAFNNFKKPNIDHFAHQVNVTGVGAHKNDKKYSRKVNEKTVKQVIQDELEQETSLQEQADNFPNDDGDDD